MKLILTTITKKLSVKRLLQLSLVGIAVIGITVANASKEESKTPVPAAKEKAHDEEEHEEKAAALTDAQLKTASIELTKVGPASIHESLSFYGTVEANAEKVQRVGARFAGTVRSVNKKLGDSVREGETLATVESNESLKTYSITSALNGVVAERNISVGEQTTDKTAFVIVDLSTVWIDVAVFPRDASRVRAGQSVRIINPANDRSAMGEVIAVAPMGSAGNQSLSARVLLNNAEHQWTPGLFVNADVMMEKKTVVLAVRNEALQDHEGKQVVFIKEKDGFEPRPVKLGRSDGEYTEVLSGVKAGETYASKNSFIIKAELGKDGVEHDD